MRYFLLLLIYICLNTNTNAATEINHKKVGDFDFREILNYKKDLELDHEFFEVFDINNDGYDDLILGGNLSEIKPEFGPSKSSYSSLFFGNKDGKFEYINSNKSGIFIDGDLRDLIKIKINKKDSYIFALNNSEIKILERE